MKDVAQVRDGAAVQTSIVRVDGQRGALMVVMRNGRASTLTVVDDIKKAIKNTVIPQAPPDLQLRQLADQSLFVRASIQGVLREAVIAACLTGSDDSAVPRQLAQHHHRLHFDSALDSGFADRARA